MFASGALTVADLIERVPGVTGFRSGWLASPKYGAVNGDLTRIKVFYDGIEMDNLDPRSPVLDLTLVELWTLESVQIERFANEVRVHVRSWRATSTDPYTRTDVFTGDENSNLYRGFYGKRWGSGFGLQLGGQQFSTRSPRLGGGGDALSFMARVGIAKRVWSIDAYGVRRSGSRSLQPTFSTADGLSIPAYDGTSDLFYVRGAVGNQNGGPWAQVTASRMLFADRSPFVTPAQAVESRLVADTTDTTVTRFQYVGAAGFSRGALRASVTDRVRAFNDDVFHTPSARVEVANQFGHVGLYAEHNQYSRSRRADLIGRLTPLSFLAVAGAVSTSEPFDSVAATAPPSWKAARVEAGVRLVNPWLFGGFITRDTAILVGPTMFDTAYKSVRIGKRQGLYAGLRGKLFKDLNVDVVGTRWDSAGFYQPRYQARSEINIDTRWRSRFPSGNFGLKAAVIYDYRSEVRFPTETGFRETPWSGITSALLEIRILRGVASYQVRNISNMNYQYIPDFFMPRTINIYGIRWEFWN